METKGADSKKKGPVARNPREALLDYFSFVFEERFGIYVHRDGPGKVRIFKNCELPAGVPAKDAAEIFASLGFTGDVDLRGTHLMAYRTSGSGNPMRIMYGRTYEESASFQIAMQISLPPARKAASEALAPLLEELLGALSEVEVAFRKKLAGG